MHIPLERCVLRSFRQEDAESLARHANDRRIWLQVRDRFPHPYRRVDAEAWIEWVRSRDPQTSFAVEVEGEAAGAVGVELQGDVYRIGAELGYWLGAKWWGRGIMTEVVRAFADRAFDLYDLHRLWAGVYESNPGSCRVLEKAGFTREGRLRQAVLKDGKVLDLLLWARVREPPERKE